MNSILAVGIGALISLMLYLNGALEGYVGAMYSLVIIHTVGLIAVLVIVIVRKERIKIKEKLPVYLFSAGAVGVVLTLLNIITIGGIGVTLTIALAVFGQLIFSSVIDHYGLFGMKVYSFNPKKLIGFAVIILGLVIMSIGG